MRQRISIREHFKRGNAAFGAPIPEVQVDPGASILSGFWPRDGQARQMTDGSA